MTSVEGPASIITEGLELAQFTFFCWWIAEGPVFLLCRAAASQAFDFLLVGGHTTNFSFKRN